MSRAWREEIAEEILDTAADHPMWIGADGEPLDYLPEREGRISEFVYEAADAVLGKVAELLGSEETREAVLKVLLADAWLIEDAVDATDAAFGVLRERCGGGA